MAKLERTISHVDFNGLIYRIEQGILNGSATAELEDSSDYENGDTRVAVRVFERYSAIGSNRVRRMLAEKMTVRWATVIHPRATVSPYAQLGEGTVVMPHAVINACATVGKHCIINTGAVAEHDNRLGDYVHLSPNAALGGTVTVGSGTHIGIGACVRNNIRICEGCTVGAGAAVVRDITVPGTYVGIPAGRIK